MDFHYAQMRLDQALRSHPAHMSSLGAQPAPQQILRERFAGRTVLLVDDDEINREIGLDLLSLAGLNAQSAVDGKGALDFVRRQHCDLILMDVNMPRMDGIEATRRLRQCAGSSEIPIVALTADCRFDDRGECTSFGMNDSLSKPIEPDLFYATILKWLSIGQLA